jgi:hypothetical protein
MPTGIDDIDEMVEGGKSVASDVKSKWKTKLIGLAIAAVGGLIAYFTRGTAPNTAGHTVFYVGIGAVVVGVVVILGVGGIKWICKQAYSAGKNTPTPKL